MTIKDVINKVKEIAAERPDVTYGITSCLYAGGKCSDGSTGCLFGQALLALGVPLEKLEECDELPNPEIDRVFEYLGIEGTEQQIKWCAQVQQDQDFGRNWGEIT